MSFVILLKIGDGNKPILVTSDDLKSRNPNYAPASATSTDEALAQGNHGISIVSLAPGQAIRLECEAILVFIWYSNLMIRVLASNIQNGHL